MDTAHSRPVRIAIGASASQMGPQGQHLTPVIHRGVIPVEAVSAGRIHMPGGHVAHAHRHRTTELIVYVLDGWAATLWGQDMQPIAHGPGSMLYVPAGVPHTAVNLSMNTSVLAVEFQSNPDFGGDVELMPELDPVAASRVEPLRAEHADHLGNARATGRAPW
ncbi:cupin domain-containing protein [Amycolatopsis anabasis]|uniref:cupin domain-containing protein n=1 Tax=Amycolatopsis anabasis TaxID=1840409 RepID=UPI00131C27FB|nr:cupin domain-containing protein [Amycolatopsis anabasis]